MKSTKLKTFALVLLAFGLALGACSGGGSEPTSQPTAEKPDAAANQKDAPAQEAAKEPVEITFWHNWETGPSGESIKQSVARFNELHPHIKVNAVYAAPDGSNDSVTSKLMTAVAAGNPPDVFLASRNGVAESMAIETDLTELAARDGITADLFYPWAWAESTYEGKLLGLPYDGTARALWYNKDHFIEAGLDPEKPPRTIKELEEYAAKLTKKEGNRYTRFGLIPWWGQGWLYSWGWAFGGEFIDESTGKVTANNPKIVEALDWMANFGKTYGIEDVNSFVNSAGSNATDPFLSGQLSMMINGNWMIQQAAQYNPDLNYGLAYIPSPDGNTLSTFVGGRVLLIPKGAKHQEEAWEFIKWMCATEEGQSFKKITGEFAAMPSVNDKLYGDDPLQKVFLELLPHGNYRPVTLAGNLMWDELAKAPDLVMHGQYTAQQILDQITDKVNKEIETKKAQQ
ncbi:ABC transporter substrate-binding protein [Paenibacillus sp.]|uniref:ABC transporter substrate-binding protein n=1 Tax=Paenibacillus sp. TaxID=58172 RepID=UPI002D4161BF|nr:ABC transporter substrate-binding protein [Paenibacillus sp.]HZG86426.1 ABC transporter substrate-binding protein [Paenibacillus sp.]